MQILPCRIAMKVAIVWHLVTELTHALLRCSFVGDAASGQQCVRELSLLQ